MIRRETLKGDISKIRLKKTKTEEGEVLKKERAIVIEKKGALTETQSCLTGIEKQLIEIGNIRKRIVNLQTKIAGFLERTTRGADHMTDEDLDQDLGSVRLVVIESLQIEEHQGRGLAVQAGEVMESRGDLGLGSALQDQGQKDDHRSRLRGRGPEKVERGHARVLKNFWTPLVGLTGQKRPKSG